MGKTLSQAALLRVILYLFVLLLCGCQPKVCVVVFNGTGDPIMLSQGEPNRRLYPLLSVSASQSRVFGGNFSREDFILVRRGHTYHYAFSNTPPPRDYLDSTSDGMAIFVRVEKDNCLYLLKPDSDPHSPERPPQVAGFPIRPK